MPQLHVALHDGFERESVIVTAGDREVYRNAEVTTRTEIGIAAAFDIEADRSTLTLRISLPNRGLATTRELDIETDRYVAISVLNDQIEITESPEPFRYA